MYVCEYCHKEYDTPYDRAACEMKCYKLEEQKETEAKKKAALVKREAAQKEINGLLDDLEALRSLIEDKIAAYNKEFGLPYKTDRMINGLFDAFTSFGGFRW